MDESSEHGRTMSGHENDRRFAKSDAISDRCAEKRVRERANEELEGLNGGRDRSTAGQRTFAAVFQAVLSS
ncbi:hypothetical protein Y032_0008g62 [Ancylostoma ceylanicum]|uniref:Uncharacterized protein n=1 Tax=Ancylostoma ceylanicum TaxID=53326 RepID=A0A016VKV8_9BILA|nr:hypothetical protein Y032_0008g62 [Ancylostoma ceylanicum]